MERKDEVPIHTYTFSVKYSWGGKGSVDVKSFCLAIAKQNLQEMLNDEDANAAFKLEDIKWSSAPR
jgi:hypothetical protein